MAVPNRPADTSSEAEAAIFDLVDGFDRAYQTAAAEVSLSAAQACVLSRLDEDRGMGFLAQELGCDASNITQIVRRLEALGLAARQPSPHDGRARMVARTAAGDRTTALFDQAFTFARAAVGRLTLKERAELTRMIRKALG